jgi:hypothetical protein
MKHKQNIIFLKDKFNYRFQISLLKKDLYMERDVVWIFY